MVRGDLRVVQLLGERDGVPDRFLGLQGPTVRIKCHFCGDPLVCSRVSCVAERGFSCRSPAGRAAGGQAGGRDRHQVAPVLAMGLLDRLAGGRAGALELGAKARRSRSRASSRAGPPRGSARRRSAVGCGAGGRCRPRCSGGCLLRSAPGPGALCARRSAASGGGRRRVLQPQRSRRPARVERSPKSCDESAMFTLPSGDEVSCPASLQAPRRHDVAHRSDETARRRRPSRAGRRWTNRSLSPCP